MSRLDTRNNIGLILEKVVFYGLLLSILIAAIPNGSVDPASKSLFILAVCVFAVIRVVENLLRGDFKLTDPILIAPLAGITVLAVFQLIPTYLGNQFESIASADQYETKKFITSFIALILMGEMLLRYTTTRDRIQTLVYLVIAIGVGSALSGLFLEVFPIGEVSVLDPVIGENAQYGQFINRNHFAFMMEMTLGLLIGLVLKAELKQSLKLICGLMIGILSVAAIMVNSRGGILSIIGLCVFALIVHFSTRNDYQDDYLAQHSGKISALSRVKALVVPVAVFCVFIFAAIFTVAFVGGDPVVSRIETIQSEVAESKGKLRRSEIWRSTIELIKKNPVSGVGFGAYGVTITRYDDSPGDRSLQRAHNDYLEILANGGIIAFLLMLTFLIILVFRMRKQFASRSRLRKASCFGAGIGIFGVMLHNFVDFGLHTTINALVFIVLIVISTARLPKFDKSSALLVFDNK